ncbi:MAG: ATP-binding protein [Lachnospira sp.]
MKEIRVDALVDNISVITQFVDEELESWECPLKVQMQIDIAIDEIISNIAYYAYNEDAGLTGNTDDGKKDVLVQIDINNVNDIPDKTKKIVITFIDKGIPYNPLTKKDPDITLSVEERGIGGLGIFMVKKSMDDMLYEYKDRQNVLTIIKYY